MNEEMKGYWKYFAILVAGSVLNLVGGILGKTTLGYILFFVGLAVVIAGFAFVFLKKDYFKADRLKVLILGLVLAILLGASITLLLNSTFTRPTTTGNAMFSGMSGGRSASNFGGNSGGFRSNNGTTGTQSATGTTTGQTAAANGGGLLGVLLGWVLLIAGGILLLVTAIRLLTKKVSYAGNRWKVLLLGLLVGAMLSSSTALLLTRHSRQGGFPGQMPSGQMPSGQNGPDANGTMMPPDGTPGAAPAGQETATVAATAAPTATATPAPTNTPAATATATTQTYSSLVVCLDYDQGVGENIRTSPLETGTIVGTIPMAGCFTIDGKNSQYPDWYHFSSGQNGMGGISISIYADDDNLWVYNHHFDKAQSFLDGLAEVPYTSATTATPAATVAPSATPTK
ncbi:MAG: hypothetical protein VB013_04640 [Anaerolineaceae bacterium]|nr:hypothetical protein [Anaerolineaceae bacterium]